MKKNKEKRKRNCLNYLCMYYNPRIMHLFSILFVLIFSFIFSSLSSVTNALGYDRDYSAEPEERFVILLDTICVMLVTFIPIVAVLLFVAAGIAYGIGHFFGSEIREKAKSWATNMIIGAIIGLIITFAARPVMEILVPGGFPEDFCQPTYENIYKR